MNSSSEQISWKEAWKSPAFRLSFGITVLGLIVFALVFPAFFDFIEARSGPTLNDYILNIIPSADVSWVVFFFLYSGIIIGFITLINAPKLFVLAFQTYILVTVIRMVSITLIPLNPPEGYIALREPFVQIFTNDHRIISRDLFFSGHVSTICSVLFCVRHSVVKWIITICTVMISLLVLVQHVHYSIDVIMAPVATYGCYLMVKRIHTHYLSPKPNLLN